MLANFFEKFEIDYLRFSSMKADSSHAAKNVKIYTYVLRFKKEIFPFSNLSSLNNFFFGNILIEDIFGVFEMNTKRNIHAHARMLPLCFFISSSAVINK